MSLKNISWVYSLRKIVLFALIFLIYDTSFLFSKEKLISLTFHDGPNPNSTPQLLKILDDANIKATFFVVGKMVKKYPELLKEIHARGHEIANHTYNHRNLTMLSTSDIMSELLRTKILIKEIVGLNTHLFTPPGGRFDSRVIETARICGFRMALWSVFPEDHRNPSPVIYEKVITNARDGSVVLLHNGPQDTLIALPKIIEKLKARAYKFDTLSSLLSKGKGKHIVYPRN